MESIQKSLAELEKESKEVEKKVEEIQKEERVSQQNLLQLPVVILKNDFSAPTLERRHNFQGRF